MVNSELRLTKNEVGGSTNGFNTHQDPILRKGEESGLSAEPPSIQKIHVSGRSPEESTLSSIRR